MAAEWEARKRLAPGVTTPEIDRIVEAAASAGGAAKVCGAGGGGMVAVWARPGRRETAAAAHRGRRVQARALPASTCAASRSSESRVDGRVYNAGFP